MNLRSLNSGVGEIHTYCGVARAGLRIRVGGERLGGGASRVVS